LIYTVDFKKSLAVSERTVTHLESEKARLIREINAARDLSSTIERSKHELHEKIMALTMEYDALQGEINRIATEKEIAMDQLKSEVFCIFLKV
jgi:chromosome segregation ATPase